MSDHDSDAEETRNRLSASVFPAKKEKPPRNGGRQAEMTRVRKLCVPGISEPMDLGATWGGTCRIVLPPLRDDQNLIALGSGGCRSVGAVMEKHAKSLAILSAMSDTESLRCWQDNNGNVYPLLPNPFPGRNEIENGIFVDNITATAKANNTEKPRDLLFGFLKALNNGERLNNHDSHLWVSMTPIGQPKADGSRDYKVMMANVDLRVVELVVTVLSLVQWTRQAQPKAFRGGQRVQSIHKIVTSVCEFFSPLIADLRCEDRITEAVGFAVRGRIQVLDVDFTHDFRGTLNADRAAKNIEEMIGVDLSHKCGKNCVRSEWLVVQPELYLPVCKDQITQESAADGDPMMIDVHEMRRGSTSESNNELLLSPSCNTRGLPETLIDAGLSPPSSATGCFPFASCRRYSAAWPPTS